jgi:parallel beta-helix repeat protein
MTDQGNKKRTGSVFSNIFTPRSNSITPKTTPVTTPNLEGIPNQRSQSVQVQSPMTSKPIKEIIRGEVFEEDPEMLKVSAQDLLVQAKKSGYFDKQGHTGLKQWKKRFFVLIEGYLYYFDDENSKEAASYIVLNYPKAAQKFESGKHTFKLQNWGERVYNFAADSDLLAEGWIYAINQACHTPTSKFITEARMTGWIQKKSKNPNATIWKSRFMAVHGKSIYIFRGNEDALHCFEVEATNAKLVHLDNNFHGTPVLQVTSNKRNLIFKSDFDDVGIWECAIKEASEKLVSDLRLGIAQSGLKAVMEFDTAQKLAGYKPHFIVVRGTQLFWFAKETDNEPIGVIDVRGKIVTKNEKDAKEIFRIEHASNIFYFKAKSVEIADVWVASLKNIAKEDLRSLNKSGWLVKQGGSIKTWKKRWCVLKENELYYYADKEDPEAKGSVNLSGFMIRVLNAKEATTEVDKKFCIKIFQPQRTWYLAAESAQDVYEWGIALRKASLKFVGGKTLHVDNTKKKEGFYKTITEAMAAAEPNDQVVLHAGEYREEILIKKPLLIRGEGDVTLRGTKKQPITMNIVGSSSISGLKIIQEGVNADVEAVLVKQGNLLLENCHVESQARNGVTVLGTCHCSLVGTTLKGSKQYGIQFIETSSALLENCLITHNGWDGVMIMDQSEATVRGCSINNNSYNGVSSGSDSRVQVEHCNIFENAWDGIQVGGQKSQIVLYNNTIFYNKGFGIFFEIPTIKGKKGTGSEPDPTAGKLEVDNKIYDNKKGAKNFE